MRVIVLIPGILGTVLLLTASGAAAASLEVTAGTPPPLEPLREPVGVEVQVGVPCAIVNATTPPPLYLNATTASAAVHATVVPSVLLPQPSACEQGTWRGTATLLLSAGPDAAAGTTHDVTLSGSVSNGSVAATGSTTVELAMAFYSLLDVRPAKATVATDLGDVAAVDVLIANEGNAETRLTFEALEVPAGWSVQVPSAVDLGSQVTGGAASTSARVTVAPPGTITNTVIQEFKVRVNGALAADASVAGDSVVATFSILVNAAAVPFPGLALVAGAGAAAAACRRR